MKKSKITFIEKGRLNNDELNEVRGGVDITYRDCSDSGICPIFSGTDYTTYKNCVTTYYFCGSLFQHCGTGPSGEEFTQCKTEWSTKKETISVTTGISTTGISFSLLS
jgi:hypothetical protein